MLAKQTYAEAVGSFLKQFRSDHQLTLDAIARTGRKYGASWGIASIRNIESGDSSPTLALLITLGLTLNELTGEDIRLTDLLGDADEFESPSLDGMYPIRREAVDRFLRGEPIEVDYVDDLIGFKEAISPATLNITEAAMSLMKAMDRVKPTPGAFPDVQGIRPAEVMRLINEPATLAEERAAKKIGAEPKMLKLWALHLWSRSLEDEAAARAETRSLTTGKPVTAQARGAMTRELVAEIREARNGNSSGSPS